MLIVVDPHSGVPVYRQLMDQIKFHIASGVLKPGDELPSTRTLSAELGVNPMTISKAYSYLERDDVVERRPGRPLVVRAVESFEMDDRRMEQVRQALSGTVTIVRQLGVAPEDAVRAFERMLAESAADVPEAGNDSVGPAGSQATGGDR
jgi:GntR family transcriptional regulator